MRVAPIGVCVVVSCWANAAGVGEIRLVSRAYPTQFADTANGASTLGGVSDDGRFVAFVSAGLNMVPGQVDTNAGNDVFLHDRATGATVLASHSFSSSQTTGNGVSESPLISADGRFVAFASTAPNLAAGQGGGSGNPEAFLFDRATGLVTLVSHVAGLPTQAGGGNSQPRALSADGRLLAYESSAPTLVSGQTGPVYPAAVFLYDRLSNESRVVSHTVGAPTTPVAASVYGKCMSADGRRLTFSSGSTNLVAGQTGSTLNQVFLFDAQTGVVRLVSHVPGSMSGGGNGFSAGGQISADGSRIAFFGEARDLVTGYVAPPSEPVNQVYLYDVPDGSIRLVSHDRTSPLLGAYYESWRPTLSADGRIVAFTSSAGTLVPEPTLGVSNVFVYERDSGGVSLISRIFGQAQGATESCGAGYVSADGSRISFASRARNLVAGQVSPGGADAPYQAFVHDRTTGLTVMASHAASGLATSPNAGVLGYLLAKDGRSMSFASPASDLATIRDINGASDVFAFDLSTRDVSLVSGPDMARPSRTATQASQLPGHNPVSETGPDGPFVSGDGRFVLFSSAAPNLTPQLTGGGLFLFDRFTSLTTLVTHHFSNPAVAVPGLVEAASVSADGRAVAYVSDGSNLVAGGAGTSCYLWDRMSGVNTSISAPCSDVAMSADTRYVMCVQGTIYLRDRLTGVTQLVPHRAGAATTFGNGESISPALSANGRFVAYRSNATDLVPGGTTGVQVFLFDRDTGENVLVSAKAGAVGVGGNAFSQMAAIAADGSYVAYVSAATDLVAGQVDQPDTLDIFLYERATGMNRLVSHAWDSPVTAAGGGSLQVDRPFLSEDGRYAAFISQGVLVSGQTTLGSPNVFLYDRTADANTLVSHASGSTTAGVGVGAYTGFNTNRGLAGLSADGGKVLFLSSAPGVVPGQTSGSPTPQLNAYLFDRSSGTNTLASGAGGSSIRTGNGATDPAWLAREGGMAVFVSAASDLVPDDLNQATDVFLYLPDSPGPSGSMAFHTLSPCRLVDTRVPDAEWGAPPVYGGDDRSFTAAGRCGIPSSARAVSLNVTVTQPTASGDLRLFAGGAAPLASAINYRAGQTRANNAVVFLGSGGTFSLRSDQPTGAVQVVVDVNGYFE